MWCGCKECNDGIEVLGCAVDRKAPLAARPAPTLLTSSFANGFVVVQASYAFTYGALALATDEHKSSRELQKPIVFDENFSYQLQPIEKGEIVRIVCTFADGDSLLLTDYQSCGKKWLSDKRMMTVWFNGE